MARLDEERITELLAGPHQAMLSVARLTRGPLAVPISHHFAGGRFLMVTSPDSLHGRLMAKRGRATLTVQFESVTGRKVYQWYVMAEGPVAFTDEDPARHVRVMLAKDRGDEWVDRWASEGPAADDRVAVLEPERLSGFEFRESPDD